MQEIKEIKQDTSGDFLAEALESDIFEWHFVIRGPRDTEFEGGIYHGRILLPAEYPFKPPSFMMLTPNGRFETNMKICLSISSHHPEHWQPSWSVRTALMALIAFMPSPGNGALGAIDFTKDERRILAARSRTELPRFGSAERQRVIDDMHARMLTVEAEKEAERAAAQAGGSNAGPSGSGVQQTPRASMEQPGAAAAGEQGASKADGEQAAGSSTAAPVVTAAAATRTSSAGDAAAAAHSAASAPSPASKPATSAAAPSASAVSPAAAHRPAQAAAPDNPGVGYGAAGAPDMAAAAAAAAAATGQAAGTTGADHMLTALMWALYVGIGAILLRKVMGVMGVDLAELMRPYQ